MIVIVVVVKVMIQDWQIKICWQIQMYTYLSKFHKYPPSDLEKETCKLADTQHDSSITYSICVCMYKKKKVI